MKTQPYSDKVVRKHLYCYKGYTFVNYGQSNERSNSVKYWRCCQQGKYRCKARARTKQFGNSVKYALIYDKHTHSLIKSDFLRSIGKFCKKTHKKRKLHEIFISSDSTVHII